MTDSRPSWPAPLTAADVPELRARMAAWATDKGDNGASNWFTFFLGPHPRGGGDMFTADEDVAAQLAAGLGAQLPTAELFYVSEHMTKLAVHAARSLTDYRLHPQDLPAPVGLLAYHHPPVAEATRSQELRAATVLTWGPGRGGLWLHVWHTAADDFARRLRVFAQVVRMRRSVGTDVGAASRRPEGDHVDRAIADIDQLATAPVFADKLARAPIPADPVPPHGYWWNCMTPMQYTDMTGWPDPVGTNGESREATIALQRTVLATWLLMGQTISSRVNVRAPRGARRRMQRDMPGLDPTVRYVDLRRARTTTVGEPSADGEHGTRQYHHQWVVRGHWRNQWYPSRGDHRPIWIAPHLAGPDDMPLLGGERVNVLRR